MKDDFYNIPINIEYLKYFKVEWLGKSYKFLGMPNGNVHFSLTKTLKPLFSHSRSKAYFQSRFLMTLIHKVERKSFVKNMINPEPVY